MGIHYHRHIARLTSVREVSANGMQLTDLIDFDPMITRPQILKIQIMVDNFCTIIINDHSEIEIDPQYGLLLDYTDMIVNTLEFVTGGVNFYAVIGY